MASLAEILAAKRALQPTKEQSIISQEAEPITQTQHQEIVTPIEVPTPIEYKGAFSLDISLNREQLLAKEMAFSGKSFCLIGAAGTGKTTAQREIASELLRQNLLGTHTFRVQGSGERVVAPSIAFVAYTRIASGNLRRAIHKDPALEEALLHNVTTIHNLLEYAPETYWDYEEQKEKFRFIPKRTASNPLDITHLIIEEASMVGLDLWEKLYSALRPNVQIIYIGDINQLPPVFGSSILNYALVQLPVIELTHVYRQAEGSEVLDNAHRILKGEQIVEGKDFRLVRGGDTQLSQTRLSLMLGKTFPKWEEAGEYDPLQDIVLSPWNKHELGTDNMNKWIAQHLGEKRNADVYEVIAGITKTYLAVGDRILFQKQTGIITDIKKNGMYVGKAPMPHGTDLTRFGIRRNAVAVDDDMDIGAGYEDISLDKLMEQAEEDIKRQTSHIVEIELETGEQVTLSSVGDFSPAVFSLAYCLTVHKAQGCEWRKVFLILHKDHSISAFRELLYTAVTRAREQVIMIAKDFMVDKAIKNPRIKGNSIAEKIEYFNGGTQQIGDVKCTK